MARSSSGDRRPFRLTLAAAVWYGVDAPRDTSPAIVDTLNNALNSTLADARLRTRLTELGGVTMPSTPAEFGKLLAEETEKWAKVIKFAGVKLD